ncbi:Tyr recombinase domain-containing protein OS=Stutzerimonas stutzeri OX=316 GN=CXK99_06990 PE=4 SV=1 [Stutzerimonas stutzeri]
MTPTRFRFSVTSLERLSCPDDRKAIEVSDTDCPGLKLILTRTGSKTFWFRFVLAGTKGAMRIGTFPALSVTDARKHALAYRALVERGEDPRQQEEKDAALTFGQFAEEYLHYSRQHKRSHADDASKLRCWMLPRFKDCLLSSIKRRHVEAYLGELHQSHSPASVNRHLTLLSAMFRRAIAFEYLERNPCAGIARLQEAGPRQQSLTPEQAGRLLDALEQDRNPIAAAALALMLYTGTRKMECLRARWEHVDLARRVWLLPKTKSGKAQHVQLSEAAVAILETLPSRQHGGWLFPGRNRHKPLADPRKTLMRALVAAGLPQDFLCIHGLRHAHASIMVGDGRRTLAEAQQALRHASSRTTQAYLHLSSESAKAAVQSVADVIEEARLRRSGRLAHACHQSQKGR